MMYIINVWQKALNRGTACLWRGTNRAEFEKEKKKAILKYPPYKPVARTVKVTEELTVYSFADSGEAYYAWRFSNFTRKPLELKYERLD